MSARTAPLHTAAELAFVSCDHVTGIVTYAAPSKHAVGRTNHVALDTTNGAIHCDCKAAECNQDCWHGDHVAAAWAMSPPMQQVRWLGDEQLIRFGNKARTMIASYLTRAGRALPADALSIVAARSEWRGRVARATAARVRVATATDTLLAQRAVAALGSTVTATSDRAARRATAQAAYTAAVRAVALDQTRAAYHWRGWVFILDPHPSSDDAIASTPPHVDRG